MPDVAVSHTGIVRTVTPDAAVVEILSRAACGSCAAAGLCSVAEASRKEVRVPGARGFSEGEEVEVTLRRSLGNRAALLAYGLPAVLVLLLVVGLSFTPLHELWVGLAGVLALALYYGTLFLLRERISRDYVFTIQKKQ